MHLRQAPLVAFCALRLAAQPSVDALVAQIEKYSNQEERRLGLDTRIVAAERLRVIAPAAARKLLEGGFPSLQPDPSGEPDYFTFRLLNAYAAMDLDAAERAFASVPDRLWAYTALITQASRQQDFTRAIRLVRAALKEHYYSLGAITGLLQRLEADEPRTAAALQNELVNGFPMRNASFVNIQSLLAYVAQAQPIDPKLGRAAARKAMQALDNPHIRKAAPRYEDTATYTLHDRKIQTTNTYETTLLPAAAFLAVFDAKAYQVRESSLPEWKSSLAGVSATDLPGIVKAPHVGRERRPEQTVSQTPPAPRPDYSKMSKMPYDEVMSAAGTLPADYRSAVLRQVARRAELTPEQRGRALESALQCVPEIPLLGRYGVMGSIFQNVNTRRMDELFPAALDQWLAVLDAAVHSDDPMLLNNHHRGAYGADYAQIAVILDERHMTLPQTNPAVEAQRALRAIQALNLDVEDFSLTSYDGKEFRLRDLLGKVVVLDFWATWCEPCRKVLPEVVNLDREWSGKGVLVLGVDDEKPEVVRAFAAKNGLTYPTLIDRGHRVHDLFGVDGIPAAIVIGRDGKLVERVAYPHNQQNFRAALQKAGLL